MKINFKILVADSSYINISNIRKIINSFSNRIQVVNASNNDEAFALAAEELPDIILMNFDTSSIPLFKQLLSTTETKNIPVIIYTNAKPGENMLKRGLHLGAFDFIRKPFNKIIFKARITAALHYSESINKLGTVSFKEMEQQLRENEERFVSLFNNTFDAIVVFDPDSRIIIDSNPAFCTLYGYTEAEIKKLSIDDINSEAWGKGESAVKSKHGMNLVIPEAKHRKKDGTIFNVTRATGTYTWQGRQVQYNIIKEIS